MLKSIKRIINKLSYKLFLCTRTNLREYLTTEFQRVILDDRTLNKLPEKMQYVLPATFAKIDYLDSSSVIVKAVYLERKGDEIINYEEEFRFNIEDIIVLEIEE